MSDVFSLFVCGSIPQPFITFVVVVSEKKLYYYYGMYIHIHIHVRVCVLRLRDVVFVKPAACAVACRDVIYSSFVSASILLHSASSSPASYLLPNPNNI